MNPADLKEVWAGALDQMFELFGQEVSRGSDKAIVILDDLPLYAAQRSGGGGLLPDFQGTIVFKKSDFITAAAPKTGELWRCAGRSFRLAEISCKEDPIDPTITFSYKPTST